MFTLEKVEFLRRIKLKDDSSNKIWVAVDALDMDKYYIVDSDGCLTPFNELKFKYVIRTEFEALLQKGELDYIGFTKPLTVNEGNIKELYNVNKLGYIHNENMRETTNQTPRHIKLGFMQL